MYFTPGKNDIFMKIYDNKSYDVNIRFPRIAVFMVENIILLMSFEMQKVSFGSNNEHE